MQLDFSHDYTTASVSVSDAFGNMAIKDIEVNNGARIDLSSLAKGLYTLHINIHDEMTYRKVIKY